VLLDDKAKVLYTGPPVLGYAQGEHRHQEVLALIHPEDREQVGKLFAELTKQPGQTKTAVFRALNKTGSWRWIEAVIQNLLHEPSVAGVVANYRDITERRQLEDQFRQAQKLESLGVLAGGVAHDFNNLLTGILGNATLAADTLSSQHPARPMLRDVIAASESAAHLTRQLLAYSGKGRFFVEPINLSDLVRQIGGLVQASIPKTVQLWLDLAERLPMIQADSGQIQQLVMNLVINGAEAIPQGQTGTVTLTTSVQDIDQSYIRTSFGPDEISPGEYVVVEVRDTGTGMDIQTISKIFDPFFTTKFTGRGLGLAAVQGIVRAHHGALKVYSSPGKGTSFKVVFPSIAAPAANQEPDRKPERRARELRGSGTILVIDDEQIVRRVAKSVLESFGYTVLLAENGLEGSQLFRSSPDGIALVLLDMTMPVMSGEETLRELRSIRPDIKIILSSGYNEVDAVQRFAGKALAGFIQKPYSAVALAEKVTTILGASE